MEAISNVMQHAQARVLTVAASTSGEFVVIELRDDGVGLSGPSGNGLRGMQQRAALINATLELQAARPSGLALRLMLPLGAV